METILIVVLSVLGGLVLSMIIALLVLRAMLRRQLRVSIGRKSVAPTHWVAPLSRAARLHRRLRVATVQARLQTARLGAGAPALVDGVRDLEHHACAVEIDLVSEARTPRPHRRQALMSPTAEVQRIEASVRQLTDVAQQWEQTMTGPQPLLPLQDRLRAYTHATDQVQKLEQPPLLVSVEDE